MQYTWPQDKDKLVVGERYRIFNDPMDDRREYIYSDGKFVNTRNGKTLLIPLTETFERVSPPKMNNNLIITHKDGRTWNEGQLESLYKTFDGEMGEDDNIFLCSATGPNGTKWCLYNEDYVATYELDPSLYTVSPVGMIAVEKVREMIEEMKACYPLHSIKSLNDKKFDAIASKYLGEEN